MKISVIDLGFNSAKLVNYNVGPDNSFITEEEFSVKARVGEGIGKKGYLNEQAMKRAITALKEFRGVIHMRKIKNILPIATSAVREASNQHNFLQSVQRETGFKFKVLSEQEEGLYSYLGASRVTCFPEALFFDLGGGSLELVSAKGYNLKKIISLPLGALRLSEKYVTDGALSKRGASLLAKDLSDKLPTSKDLEVSNQIPLVGIGGSVRTIARYHQKIMGYPLAKLHNYSMDYFSIQSIRKDLYRLGYTELANIDVIGSKRAHTITVAAFVIEKLMQKLGVKKMVVSAHGLREGYLYEYLRNPLDITRRLDTKNVHKYIDQERDKVLLDVPSEFMRSLINFGIINSSESQIFGYAEKMLSNHLIANSHIDVLFELIMSEICPMLSHEDQLILALSLVYRRKPKNA